MYLHVQAVLPVHGMSDESVHLSVLPSPQQRFEGEQDWPALPQVWPTWQVPVVDPGLIVHWYPLQQSAFAEQAPPCGWQVMVVHTPPLHVPEQHCVPVEQPAPLSEQPVPASVPASGTGLGIWHA